MRITFYLLTMQYSFKLKCIHHLSYNSTNKALSCWCADLERAIFIWHALIPFLTSFTYRIRLYIDEARPFFLIQWFIFWIWASSKAVFRVLGSQQLTWFSLFSLSFLSLLWLCYFDLFFHIVFFFLEYVSIKIALFLFFRPVVVYCLAGAFEKGLICSGVNVNALGIWDGPSSGCVIAIDSKVSFETGVHVETSL